MPLRTLYKSVFKTTDSLRLSPPALRIPGAAPGLELYKNPRLTVILYALRVLFLFSVLLSYYLVDIL